MQIIIYSTPICTRCKILKAACGGVGISYEEGSLDGASRSECLTDTDVWVTSAPLVKNGAVWYFCDDLFSPSGDLLPTWEDTISGYQKPRNKGPFEGHAVSSTKVQACSKIWK